MPLPSVRDMAEDDDEVTLSTATLGILQEFLQERDSRLKEFEDLKLKSENDFQDQDLSIDTFAEDWNASQFWYTDATAEALARQLLDGPNNKLSRIAVVSAPSVFIKLKRFVNQIEEADRPDLRLLEFDERFNVFKEFVSYDFAQPLRLDESMKGQFDRILCDPPFLSSDCQIKTATTVRWLAKSWEASEQRIIVCTGERMESLILKLYGKVGVKTTSFLPEHAKGLSNEFKCYANFPSDLWSVEAVSAEAGSEPNSFTAR